MFWEMTVLNDAELIRLRTRFFQAGVGLVQHFDEGMQLAWADVLLDPSETNLGALLSETWGSSWHGRIAGELVEIGLATAPDVLIDIPSALDRVGNRRWQLRRELAHIVDGMDDDQLQRTVYRARSIAQ